MTNEEKKSNEIAAEYLMGHDRLEVTYEEMREAVMTMAKWKDQQFKEYLEKKSQKLILSKNWVDGLKLQFLGEIFNELFGETEEVDHSNNDE